MHLVEEFELTGQLVGRLPLGGELGPFLVVVMVGQILACVGVPAKGPEAVQMDLLAHGGGQRVHKDPRAQSLRRKVLRLPVSEREQKTRSVVEEKQGERQRTLEEPFVICNEKISVLPGDQKWNNFDLKLNLNHELLHVHPILTC